MKKIILSVAVATMALSTAAAALEDIKVSGQAKLWYETNNAQNKRTTESNKLFQKDAASGEVVFKLGVTGKQGNIGLGATLYDTSSMGLAQTAVAADRDQTTDLDDNPDAYFGELYITAPLGSKTLLKFGKQELDTPLVYTERWNAVPNTFNAAVVVNNSIENVTIVGAYVGQGSIDANGTSGYTTTTGTPGSSDTTFMGTSSFAAGAMYKANGLAVNGWAYSMASVASALWLDAGMAVSGIDLKAYVAQMTPAADDGENTTAYALSASTKVSGITLMGAGSKVSEGDLAMGNVATNNKKTKLPTMGVYTDGLYVAQPGSKAFKIKASGKMGTTGIALQGVQNTNGTTGSEALETTEVDLILTQKMGDFNMKAIIMDRNFDQAAAQTAKGGQHVRIIASVNF